MYICKYIYPFSPAELVSLPSPESLPMIGWRMVELNTWEVPMCSSGSAKHKSDTTMASVITRGVSRETSSCFSPLPSHNFLQCHTTGVEGRPNFMDKIQVLRLSKNVPI